MKYKTRYSCIVPKNTVGTVINEDKERMLIMLRFDNSEQFWFFKRDLKEVSE